jgi:hypothetical protein
MKSSDRKIWYIAALFAWGVCCFLALQSFLAIKHRLGGVFVYPLDDSYIHLAIAKTLGQHGVWGLNPRAFASASSSPGWTAILALIIRIAGNHLFIPIVLNVILTLGASIAICEIVRTSVPATPVWAGFLIASAALCFAPLQSTILLGMEHVAQTFSVLLLCLLGSRYLAGADERRELWFICAAAAFSTVVRYEGIFTVGSVCALLLLRRRFVPLTLVAFSGLLPILLFGAYFYQESGFFLPYSVAMKSLHHHFQWHTWKHATVGEGAISGALLPMLLLFTIMRVMRRRKWEEASVFCVLVLLITNAHFLLAPTGWLMRYEAYVIALLVSSVGTLLASFAWEDTRDTYSFFPWLTDTKLNFVAGIFLLASLPAMLSRGWRAERDTVQASVDRNDEHIQMGRFISRFYNDDVIVLDDIGVVS